MKSTFPALLLLLSAGCADQQDERGCASAQSLAGGMLRIERAGHAQGSAFMTKPTEMVTVKHVAERLKISHTWQHVSLLQKTQLPFEVWNNKTVLMRRKGVFGSGLPEELHLLEIQEPLTWPVSVVSLRTQPLSYGEPTTGVGYTRGNLRFGSGNFVHEKFPLNEASSARTQEFAGFRLTNSYEEYPLSIGSSGGGIFDCRGSLVAVIARAHNEETSSPGRINVFAVPVHSIAKEILR